MDRKTFSIQPIKDLSDANKALKAIQDKINKGDEPAREQIRIISDRFEQLEKVTYSAFGGGVIEVPTDSEGGNQDYTNSFIENTVKRNDLLIPYDDVLASNVYTVQEISVTSGITYTTTRNSDGNLLVSVTGLTVDEGYITLDVKVLDNVQDIRFLFKVVKVKAVKRYYIEQNGSVLKNGSGTITLQAKFDDGILNQNISSGDVKLVDENAVNYNYSASITNADFSGAKTLRVDLKDTVLGNVYASLTLVIVDDGADGATGATGASGISNRLDIAWGDNSDGSGNSQFPTGTLVTTYTKATKSASNNYQGTRLVTWTAGDTEPAVSTTVGDYEWTRATSILNRIDISYSDSDNGVGNLQLPTGKLSTTYTPATPAGTSYYQGTNVVSWNADETEPAVSATVGDYKWAKFRGDDGQDGQDALGSSPVIITYDVLSDSLPNANGEWSFEENGVSFNPTNFTDVNRIHFYKDDKNSARFEHYFNMLVNVVSTSTPIELIIWLDDDNWTKWRITSVVESSGDFECTAVKIAQPNASTDIVNDMYSTIGEDVQFRFSLPFQPIAEAEIVLGAKDSDGDTILGDAIRNAVQVDYEGNNPTYTDSYLDIVVIDELGTTYEYDSSISATDYDKYTVKNIQYSNIVLTLSTVSNQARLTASSYTHNSKIGYSYGTMEIWIYRNGQERYLKTVRHEYAPIYADPPTVGEIDLSSSEPNDTLTPYGNFVVNMSNVVFLRDMIVGTYSSGSTLISQVNKDDMTIRFEPNLEIAGAPETGDGTIRLYRRRAGVSTELASQAFVGGTSTDLEATGQSIQEGDAFYVRIENDDNTTDAIDYIGTNTLRIEPD